MQFDRRGQGPAGPGLDGLDVTQVLALVAISQGNPPTTQSGPGWAARSRHSTTPQGELPTAVVGK
jgi:hypothetical protein